MTFGIAFASPAYAGVVTDRRISGGRREDDFSKSGVVEFRNGRFAYTFSGLAADTRAGFDASTWLPETLCRAGAPDGAAVASIERFAEVAADRFATLPTSAADKRTTIVLVGFVDNAFGLSAPPLVYVVSNFEDLTSQLSASSSPTFVVSSDQLEADRASVRLIGSANPAALDFGKMAGLISRGVPPQHITAAAVELIREAAKDPHTRDTIGTRCSSVVLGRTGGAGLFSDYHVDTTTHTYRDGAYVCAHYGSRGAWLIVNPEYTGYDAQKSPVPVRTPTAPKNAPCPCGSGRRYKDCHRRRNNFAPEELRGTMHFMMIQQPTEDVSIASMYKSGMLPGSGTVPWLGTSAVIHAPEHPDAAEAAT